MPNPCPWCKQGLCDNEGSEDFGKQCRSRVVVTGRGTWTDNVYWVPDCPDNPNRCEEPHSELPWPERVNMLSVHPDAATRDDIARMAAELSEVLKEVERMSSPHCKKCGRYMVQDRDTGSWYCPSCDVWKPNN